LTGDQEVIQVMAKIVWCAVVAATVGLPFGSAGAPDGLQHPNGDAPNIDLIQVAAPIG